MFVKRPLVTEVAAIEGIFTVAVPPSDTGEDDQFKSEPEEPVVNVILLFAKLAFAIAVPFHTPVVIVPSVVIDVLPMYQDKAVAMNAVVAIVVLFVHAVCVVAVVPFASAVDTDHVPARTCAIPVDEDVLIPVPQY